MLYHVIKKSVCFLIILSSIFCFAQDIELERVEPPSWWIGFKNTKLQLLVHGKNISMMTPIINHENIELKSTTRLESNNYLFLDLEIGPNAKAGTFDIIFKNKDKELLYTYVLEEKSDRVFSELSVNGSDVMYLITPDRFANGDPSNDSTDDTVEKVNRNDSDGRHGGDLKGIIEHFDYIEDLGVTALWLNPILENDQPKYSYHGYGISDFYKTDARFGSNEDFLKLTDLCHKNGMKMIMDQVFNHCGSGHWWMNDLPSQDWLNQWETYTNSSFTNISISDPYSADSDLNLHSNGWFDTNLPDLNQRNPFMETYLIQNSIWWIEYAQLDGIRMDTYPYPDKDVMARWVKCVYDEYPNFYLVAETSELDVASVSYWNSGVVNKDGYQPIINSVSDYPLYYAMLKAFGEQNEAYRIYETLAYDYLYGSPFNNKIFNGNHDVPRLFSELNENKDKVKLSMAFILTTRGIPQLYYGDELLFEGEKPDGILRKDFPGGWKNDKKDLFNVNDRNSDETEVYNYVKSILDWRKNAKEIHSGQLKHYKPTQSESVYVYFRYLEDESTMVIINNRDQPIVDFSLDHYKESLKGYSSGIDILSKNNYKSLKFIDLDANKAYIIKLNH